MCSEEPDGLWIMDFMDFKSIKSIIHGFGMDLDGQIPNPMDLGWIWIYGSVENGLWIGYGL